MYMALTGTYRGLLAVVGPPPCPLRSKQTPFQGQAALQYQIFRRPRNRTRSAKSSSRKTAGCCFLTIGSVAHDFAAIEGRRPSGAIQGCG
jgi:hypothetical protein